MSRVWDKDVPDWKEPKLIPWVIQARGEKGVPRACSGELLPHLGYFNVSISLLEPGIEFLYFSLRERR